MKWNQRCLLSPKIVFHNSRNIVFLWSKTSRICRFVFQFSIVLLIGYAGSPGEWRSLSLCNSGSGNQFSIFVCLVITDLPVLAFNGDELSFSGLFPATGAEIFFASLVYLLFCHIIYCRFRRLVLSECFFQYSEVWMSVRSRYSFYELFFSAFMILQYIIIIIPDSDFFRVSISAVWLRCILFENGISVSLIVRRSGDFNGFNACEVSGRRSFQFWFPKASGGTAFKPSRAGIWVIAECIIDLTQIQYAV